METSHENCLVQLPVILHSRAIIQSKRPTTKGEEHVDIKELITVGPTKLLAFK